MAVRVATKAAVTVPAMAAMCGLSVARFTQLVGSAFPRPVYDPTTGRPVYTEEQQRVCLEVRRQSRGVDGRPVRFDAGWATASTAGKRKIEVPPEPAPREERIAALLAGLNGVGLTTATAAQIQRATGELFPGGTAGIEQAEVLRRVFLHLGQPVGSAKGGER